MNSNREFLLRNFKSESLTLIMFQFKAREFAPRQVLPKLPRGTIHGNSTARNVIFWMTVWRVGLARIVTCSRVGGNSFGCDDLSKAFKTAPIPFYAHPEKVICNKQTAVTPILNTTTNPNNPFYRNLHCISVVRHSIIIQKQSCRIIAFRNENSNIK